MDITFINGTAEQQAAVTQALGFLLHLDLDRYQFAMVYEFSANPSGDPVVHHPLALTTSEPGSATTNIRDDFPDYVGLNDLRWAYETVVHELGHAILHQLPATVQEQLAALFGTTPETWEPAITWEDRPEEGIAETFKDAFLPQAHRVNANRTTQRIPISKYAEFRRLFRRGAARADGAISLILPNGEDAYRTVGTITTSGNLVDRLHIHEPVPGEGFVVSDSAVIFSEFSAGDVIEWRLRSPSALISPLLFTGTTLFTVGFDLIWDSSDEWVLNLESNLPFGGFSNGSGNIGWPAGVGLLAHAGVSAIEESSTYGVRYEIPPGPASGGTMGVRLSLLSPSDITFSPADYDEILTEAQAFFVNAPLVPIGEQVVPTGETSSGQHLSGQRHNTRAIAGLTE